MPVAPEKTLEFERLLATLSSRFINLPAEQVEGKINHALKRVVECLGIDRCSFFELGEDKKTIVTIQSYSIGGIEPFNSNDLGTVLPWYAGKILQGDTIVYSRLPDDLPPEAVAEKEYCRLTNMRSNLTIPIKISGGGIYAIAFGTFRAEKEWSGDLIPRLRLVGEIISNAMVRKRSDEKSQQALVEIRQLQEQLERDCIYLQEEVRSDHNYKNITGKSNALKYVLHRVGQVAPSDATVLIQGETGTGKELIARAIHDASPRRRRPLVKLNCAALPPSIIESELFGHEKGAFSGAHGNRIGRFEFADGATLFLDEIGELPLDLQPKLLRVIEDGEFERVGTSWTRSCDVRIIAVTNRDLEKEVKKGRFRQDLWYRLNVFPITAPPLRHRREDIPMLINSFVEKFNKKMGKEIRTVSGEIMDRLQAYEWPGNVRELQNVIERGVIVSQGDTLQIVDQINSEPREEPSPLKSQKLEDKERQFILETLDSASWKIEGLAGAAHILGLNPSTLRYRMKKLGIRRP